MIIVTKASSRKERNKRNPSDAQLRSLHMWLQWNWIKTVKLRRVSLLQAKQLKTIETDILAVFKVKTSAFHRELLTQTDQISNVRIKTWINVANLLLNFTFPFDLMGKTNWNFIKSNAFIVLLIRFDHRLDWLNVKRVYCHIFEGLLPSTHLWAR